jgi:predicted Zn-dependent protease
MHLPPEKKLPADDRTPPPFSEQLRQRAARAGFFDLRGQWWRLLDAWETRRAMRWTTYATLALAVAGGALGIWVYPSWMQRNAIGMTRQWIAAGRLDRATEVLQEAFVAAPERAELWQLAAEIARRRKNKKLALEYSRHAAAIAPADPVLALEWTEDALLAGAVEEAGRALAGLPKSAVDGSARAQRAAGEIARRQHRLSEARDHFEISLRLEGPTAINEVPLATVLLETRDPAGRQRASALLAKWTADPEWGASALRALLGDAIASDDRAAMSRWAEALRVHPLCTIGDMPNCLLALSRGAPANFARVLAELEKNHAAEAGNIALLLGWLNQIDRSEDGARWLRTLPSAVTRKPPVIAIGAEALRQTAAWAELNVWVNEGSWASDLEFLRLAYGISAARGLGEAARAEELWHSLQSDADVHGVHALFAADTIYAWGWQREALLLWWKAVDQPGLAIEALGNLARHYQVQHDAEGQYQVFRRLYSLRSADAAIINNYAFFAALTDHEMSVAERLAREIHQRAPENLSYRSTYAFVLCMREHNDQALALLQPLEGEIPTSSGLAFAYGFALAKTGQKTAAGKLLNSLDPATLTARETELIKAVLN